MSNIKNSSVKKEIFLPPKIGDWTNYTSEKNQQSISISKSIGANTKSISEENLSRLLFFHQELLENFFEKIADEIKSHIDIDSISIDLLDHKFLKSHFTSDVYQCKFSIPELEQIDLILTNRAAKCISHRLCGGNNVIEEFTPLTSIEVTLVSVINNIFLNLLSEKWNTIFPYIENAFSTHFGHYEFNPQQSENETIIEINSNFKLLGHDNLQLKIIYSLETIEKLLFFEDMITSNIVDNLNLQKEVINNTKVPIKSIIGTTTLALEEIQKIEIGDVIFLENQKIEDPIKLIIDDQLQFQVVPIKASDRNLGIQVLNHVHYESFLQEKSKPKSGPFITSVTPTQSTETAEPTASEPPPEPEIESITENIEEPESTFNEPENIEEGIPNDEQTPESSDGDDDDFSWDD